MDRLPSVNLLHLLLGLLPSFHVSLRPVDVAFRVGDLGSFTVNKEEKKGRLLWINSMGSHHISFEILFLLQLETFQILQYARASVLHIFLCNAERFLKLKENASGK